MAISLMTTKDNKIVLNGTMKNGVSLKEACELAQNEVDGGYADYAVVYRNGKIYKTFEPENYDSWGSISDTY